MLAIYSGVAFTVSGSAPVVAANATVEVRREDTNGIADIYSDEAGTTPITNPSAFADANGRFAFYALGLERGYKITVTKDASSYVLRNQAVGKAAQFDATTFTGASLLAAASKEAARVVLDMPQVSAPGLNIEGGYLDWTVAGNVLTVAVKTWAGNDPSAAEPVYITFRSDTAATGAMTRRKLIAATSIAINDTALLGTVNGIAFRLWCAAFDDGGTIRLALINCVTTSANAGSGRNVDGIYPLAGWGIASATLEDNAADSAQVFYSSGAAVTSKAYATLGYATWETGLAAAGTWSAAPTRAQLFGTGVPLPGHLVQVQCTQTGAVATGTTTVPNDDSIPQSGEGVQFMTQAITPTSAANPLDIEVKAMLSHSAVNQIMVLSLFQDAVANALASIGATMIQNGADPAMLRCLMLAASTAALTFKARAGAGGAGTVTFNGNAGGRYFGGVANSYLSAREIMG